MPRKRSSELDTVDCPYRECIDYQQVARGNIVWWSRKKGRYRCTTCTRTFTRNTGTMFAKKQHTVQEIVENLQLLAEGMSLRGLARVKHHSPATLSAWREEAAVHLEQLEKTLLSNVQLSQVQLDEIWSFLKKMTKNDDQKS